MGDANGTTIDVEQEKAKLRELIAEDKKRRAPNPECREPFTVAWANLVKATGINDEAVGLLFEGIRIALAEPLHRSAAEGHVKSAYMSFFVSKIANKNTGGITFKLIINLFALELISPTVDGNLDFIAQRMQRLSLNKDKKVWGFLSQSLKKLLLQPLADKTISPEAMILPQSAASLQELLGNQLEVIKGHRNNEPSLHKAVVDLSLWLETKSNPQENIAIDGTTLDGKELVEPKDTSTPPNDTIRPVDSERIKHENLDNRRDDTLTGPESMDEITARASQQIIERPAEESSVRDSDVPSNNIPKEERTEGEQRINCDSKTGDRPKMRPDGSTQPRQHDMGKVIRYLTAYQDEFDDYITKHEPLQSNLAQLKIEHEETLEEVKSLKKKLESARKEIEDAQAQRLALSGNYSELQRRLDRLETENAQLKDDIAAAEDMLTMREEHNAHQSDVAKDKMVRDLRFEYEQFSEAMADDMTAELGEVMRDLLGNVFGILKSNGVDL